MKKKKKCFFFDHSNQQPQQGFITNVTPTVAYKQESNGRTSQQSRRGSLYDSQRRSSQQSSHGHIPIESAIIDRFATEIGDKYLQDSFETEKPKSNRTSPNQDDPVQSNGNRRRSSIRFYDDIQPTENVSRHSIDDTSVSRQDDAAYTKTGYEYTQNVQPQYSQLAQSQAHSQPKENQNYSQLEYTDQTQYNPSDGVYKTEDYDTTQYVDQQNYDANQYGTTTTNDYNFQSEYQPRSEYQEYNPTRYEPTTFQTSEQPANTMYQPEQYVSDGLYQDEATKPTYDYRIGQAAEQQSYTESVPSNSNVGQKYKGNGNSTTAAAQRLQPVSKQPAKKKFT